jgi:hypothetical protein
MNGRGRNRGVAREDRQDDRFGGSDARLIAPQGRHRPAKGDLQSLNNPAGDLNRRPLNRRREAKPIGAEGRRQKSYRD